MNNSTRMSVRLSSPLFEPLSRNLPALLKEAAVASRLVGRTSFFLAIGRTNYYKIITMKSKTLILLIIAAVASPLIVATTTSCQYEGHHVHDGDVRFNQHGRYKHGKRTHAEKKYLRPR